MPEVNDNWAISTLRDGPLEIDLLPRIGGRVWDIRYNAISLLFQNPDLMGQDPTAGDLATLPTKAPEYPFPLWGGEKTWIAPQTGWPGGAPHRDLDSGPYGLNIEGRRALLTSGRCRASGLVVTRCVELLSSSRFRITHQLCNHGDTAQDVAPWSVMMLRRPMTTWFRPQTSLGRVFGNAGPAVTQDKGLATVDCSGSIEFKVNSTPDPATAISRIGDLWLVSQADADPAGAAMPDGHQMLELYNSGAYDYGEIEWIGPARRLKTGEMCFLAVDYEIQTSPPDQGAILGKGKMTQ